eukprot:TRINITY_DN67388_c0_g1_i1.p1 TRINITY_DN67388_c0_g1~~TRINITY_DN67388_c0_g1_i1.p1  ORF type:complete len:208 (-),score=36.80 TRINITY_DN67388_c0_g1_i1:7-630(-)
MQEEIRPLAEGALPETPVPLFLQWFEVAKAKSGQREPNAMTLCTSTLDGFPSARMVLLKGVDEKGFVFFTNYNSRKGQEIDANPNVACVFFWEALERSVRVEGKAERVSAEESKAYFKSRPVGSQIAAVASPQSSVVPSRQYMDERWQEICQEYPETGDGPPCPEHWGGYRIVPRMVEFWHGKRNRFHDRIRYRWAEDNWVQERLAP